MSARVLNPISMTEIGRGGLGRVVPTKAELAPVRRDLFGPVDHAANRAMVERELRAQSMQDADRWGFDFQRGVPRCDARYVWEVVEPTDVVPEPYALRGMPYLRKHAPATPRKAKTVRKAATVVVVEEAKRVTIIDKEIVEDVKRNAEMTPPQELRVPEICASDDEETDGNHEDEGNKDKEENEGNKIGDPTTPILPISARKQLAITDFMKSRKRPLKGSSKSMLEPPEKISRNTGKIRS